MQATARTVRLPSGEQVPRFGLGTWRMGERAGAHRAEVAALRRGLDAGVRLIDTAEMYGEGGAERIIAEAVQGRRDEVFIVSKVYPHNASAAGVAAACERSLARLATDRIDLYLLHWRGAIPLAETVAAFERLVAAGKIRYWGVSNFDTADMTELAGVAPGCATNQILYNLARRGPEWSLLPWQRKHGITTMAYSPIDQARLIRDRRLGTLAREVGTTPARLALAWLLAADDIITIPKAVHAEHLDDLLGAGTVHIDATLRTRLATLFPPPPGPTTLEML